MLTRATFIKAIRAIRKHEELMDRLDIVCREFGDLYSAVRWFTD